MKFRVEERVSGWFGDPETWTRRYECRYYEVASVPENWETMSNNDKGGYLWDNGSTYWFYDEDIDEDGEDDTVISVERLDK